MNWVLVVSADSTFQRRAMVALRQNAAVGAVTEQSAKHLVETLRPAVVIVNGLDGEGRKFLQNLRLIPRVIRPNVIAIGFEGDGIEYASSLEDAIVTMQPKESAA